MARDRDEQRRFENDVFYEVWRRGGNPDRIDYDRLSDCFHDRHEPEVCASRELERQRRRADEDAFAYQEGNDDAGA